MLPTRDLDPTVAPWAPTTFEARYLADDDPWDFETSTYERGRYDRIVAALDRPRFARGYEPGCSIGSLTELLAPRCDELVAVDVAPTAVTRARRRCEGRSGVQIRWGSLLDQPPVGLDLVVLSEVGYYLAPDALAAAVDRLVAVLEPGGLLVACHWLGASPDHRLHGEEVHTVLRARLAGLDRGRVEVTPGFVLETWHR